MRQKQTVKEGIANTSFQISTRKKNATIEVSHDDDNIVSNIQTKSKPQFTITR
jgi:hypothetical protein